MIENTALIQSTHKILFNRAVKIFMDRYALPPVVVEVVVVAVEVVVVVVITAVIAQILCYLITGRKKLVL